MKSIVAVLFLLLLSGAYAQMHVGYAGPPEDIEELWIINYPLGAEVRFKQLEISLENNIEDGYDLITEIEGNVTVLEDILEDMELLLEDIQDADMDGDPEDLAELYVVYKTEARNLTSEFRQIVHEMTSPDERLYLRERIRERNQERNHHEELQRTIREYNALRFQNMLELMDMHDTEAVTQARSGSLNHVQMRHIIQTAYESMGDRGFVRQKMIEERTRSRVMQDAVEQDLVENLENVLQEREQNRLMRHDDSDREVHNRITGNVIGADNGGTGGNGASDSGNGASAGSNTDSGGSSSGSGSGSGGISGSGNGGTNGGSSGSGGGK